MSSHSILNQNGREVRWGLDLPTGGFFYNEFLKEEEIEDEGNELASYNQGLTLSQIQKEMSDKFQYNVRLDFVEFDLKHAQQPTPLQHTVSQTFGVNLSEKLNELETDLAQNWI